MTTITWFSIPSNDQPQAVRFEVWRVLDPRLEPDRARTGRPLYRTHLYGTQAVAYPETAWDVVEAEQPAPLDDGAILAHFVVTTKAGNFQRIRTDLEDDPQVQRWTCGSLSGTGLILTTDEPA